MEEQHTQNEEPKFNELMPDTALDVPAPMVERAFRLIDLLVDAEQAMSLSDLARMLKMSKGSLHGLLKTLESCNAVEQDENRLYALGPRIYNLAAYVWNIGLRRLALPAMQSLAATIGETVFLARVEQNMVRIIESSEARSEQPTPHISVPRGTRLPLLAGAIGRIIVASWSLERRQAWLQEHPLPHFTERSIIDPDQFLVEIEHTARTRIALDVEEYLQGVNAVAVPITGSDGSLLAIMCMLGFTSHFGEAAMKSAGQQLLAEAKHISCSLAHL